MPKILCIEDEMSLRQVLIEELQDAGYETVEAKDGMQGLAAIQREHPDLVISDIRMPKMDGHQLLSTLRGRHPEHAELPFLFLTANGDRQAIIEGRKLGADAYLTKPVDYELLLVEVESRLAQVARMTRHKEEELVRLYKAMSSQAAAAALPEAVARAAAPAPAGCRLVQVYAASGEACPMSLLGRHAGPGDLDALAGDLQLLADAGEIIHADLKAGLRRFLVVDVHASTANPDKDFNQWRGVYDQMPDALQSQLGVRLIGLESSRILALANGLVKRMGRCSRAQFLEVDRHGLEILADMVLGLRFVSIDAALLAEPASALRQRIRSHIEALHAKGVKLLLRNCATPEARRRNDDLWADFYC